MKITVGGKIQSSNAVPYYRSKSAKDAKANDASSFLPVEILYIRDIVPYNSTLPPKR